MCPGERSEIPMFGKSKLIMIQNLWIAIVNNTKYLNEEQFSKKKKDIAPRGQWKNLYFAVIFPHY